MSRSTRRQVLRHRVSQGQNAIVCLNVLLSNYTHTQNHTAHNTFFFPVCRRYFNIKVQLLEISLQKVDSDEQDEDVEYEIDLPFTGGNRDTFLQAALEAARLNFTKAKQYVKADAVDLMVQRSKLLQPREGSNDSNRRRSDE